MCFRLAGFVFLLLIAGFCTPQAAGLSPEQGAGPLRSVSVRLEQLAAVTTHFATGHIIHNSESPRRWPADLIAEQRHVVDELRVTGAERDMLITLLGHPDPKIRTLALGALFMREDPQDLPLIARLIGDHAATFPLLRDALTSALTVRSVAEFEATQTVGDVAKSMIDFYLSAAYVSSSFEDYWAEHGTRMRSASWFLVKMRRASRQADVRRVLSEVDALPPMERAWTLFYVRSGLEELDDMVSNAAMVSELRVVGPDALMKLLQRENPTDDPDLRPVMAGNGPRAGITYALIRFILANARDLLRATDAPAVLAGAEPDQAAGYSSIMWRTAAAELRALQDPEAAAQSLKDEIAHIPLRGYQGQGEQADFAAALWRMRGPGEQVYLTNWFYTTLPLAQDNLAHGPEQFLLAVAKESRPDTPALLKSIVSSPRFGLTDCTSLYRIISIVNETLPSPLVSRQQISSVLPCWRGSAGQTEALASWRNLLRQNFGLPQLP